jgi:hypothetical protein
VAPATRTSSLLIDFALEDALAFNRVRSGVQLQSRLLQLQKH